MGNLVDGVDVEQFLEARLEARQVVTLKAAEHALVLRQRRKGHVHLAGFGLEFLFDTAHGVDDALAQARQALVFGVDAVLQPLAQLLLAVVAGLYRQLMRTQRLRAPAVQALDLLRLERHGLAGSAGLIAQLLRRRTLGSALPALVQRLGALVFGISQPALHRLQLAPQLLQGVGCGFEPRPLLGERGHFARQAHPVDVGKARELLQLAECIQPASQFFARLLQCGDALPQRGELLLQALALVAQGAQLVGVAPAQHVAAAVVDAAAVVLLVAARWVFDLAGARDGAGLAPELLIGVAAGHVKAVAQLLLQPLGVRRIRLDEELAQQRLRLRAGRALRGLPLPHMKIHQPGTQMLALHPLRQRRVVCLGHQQRQAKAAQQALGSAFPIALVVAHLHELARKGQFVRVDRQRRAQRLADANLGGVDVALAPLQALDLVGQGGVLLTALAESKVLLAFAVVQLGDLLAQAFGTLGDALLLRQKTGFIAGGRLVDAGQQLVQAIRPLLPLHLVLLQAANLRRQLL